MATIHDRRYVRLIRHLVHCRRANGFTQAEVAKALKLSQATVSKVESYVRRIDVLELRDWLIAIDYSPSKFLREVGWLD